MRPGALTRAKNPATLPARELHRLASSQPPEQFRVWHRARMSARTPKVRLARLFHRRCPGSSSPASRHGPGVGRNCLRHRLVRSLHVSLHATMKALAVGTLRPCTGRSVFFCNHVRTSSRHPCRRASLWMGWGQPVIPLGHSFTGGGAVRTTWGSRALALVACIPLGSQGQRVLCVVKCAGALRLVPPWSCSQGSAL